MGPPKITLNFAISKFVSCRGRIPRQFCLRAFVAANFAGNIFCRQFRRQIFRRRQFFAGAVFRRRRFSPEAFFAALTLLLRSKTPTRHCCLLFRKQAKQPQATSVYSIVTGEKIPLLFVYHDYHNRNCMLTTHSNFRILQLKFFAGVLLCRLVAVRHWVRRSATISTRRRIRRRKLAAGRNSTTAVRRRSRQSRSYPTDTSRHCTTSTRI